MGEDIEGRQQLQILLAAILELHNSITNRFCGMVASLN
jgi:hypothetical protein